MQTGVVKWFNNAKGYGFILPDEGEGDVFAHFSCIEMEGYKTLKAGQLVSFTITQGPKGLHASDIKTIAKADDLIEKSRNSDAFEQDITTSPAISE